MALVMPPLVQETTITSGAGTYTLSGIAPTGRQTFANAAADGQIATGDQTYYLVIDPGGGPPDFEHGIGTWTSSGNTLTRDVILKSSNAGSAVSWPGTGTRTVYIVGPRPAEKPVRTRVSRSGDQTIVGGSVGTAISWQVEDEDTAGAWASSPNPTRITVPTGYTRAKVVAQVSWIANTDTNTLWAQLTINGGLDYMPQTSVQPEANVQPFQQIVTGDLPVSAGDYFELYVTNNHPSSSRQVDAQNLLLEKLTWLTANFWRE